MILTNHSGKPQRSLDLPSNYDSDDEEVLRTFFGVDI